MRWAPFVIYGLLRFFAAGVSAAAGGDAAHLVQAAAEIYSGSIIALAAAVDRRALDPTPGAQTCVGLSCNGIKGYFWNSTKMTVAGGDHLHRHRVCSTATC